MATQIPYLIQFAHPDYKRPYINTIYGSGTSLDDIRLEIETHIYNYIIDYFGSERVASGEVKTYEDIYSFIYSEYYMNNHPINVMTFMNNKWEYFPIDYEDYLKRLHQKELLKSSHEETAHNPLYGNNYLDHIDEEIYDRITAVLDELDIESICESEQKQIDLHKMIENYIKENPKPTYEEFKNFISENYIKKHA